MRALLRILPVFLFGAFLASSFFVAAQQAPTPETSADKSQQAPAGQFVQDLGNRAIAVMADKSLSEDQRSQKYRALLHESFDLPTIGRFVIGRAWSGATPEQQQEYMKLFEDLVLKTYGDRLSFYSGESFTVSGLRQENDKDSVITSEVKHPGGAKPTRVEWRVRQANGKHAIVDVLIEGVSQSVTQRQEYASIIQRDGGKIDGLLKLMRQRLQEPDAPASKG